MEPLLSNSGTDSPTSVCLSPPPDPHPADVEALRRLSDNLSSLFPSQSNSFSDATITVGSNENIPVHRCILSSRSPFFRKLFTNAEPSGRFDVSEVLSGFEVGYEALVLVLGYLYSGKVGPLPRGVSECADEECGHVACRPAVEFLLQILFASFTFEISELVSLFQRHLLGILENVVIEDLPIILSVANLCSKGCMRLLTKCIEMVVNSDVDHVTLEKTVPKDIVKQIIDSRSDLGLDVPGNTVFPDMYARKIYRALDFDDIELVERLLEEKQTTIDAACALHYAIAHCSIKITSELLNRGLADINHKNPRGYTVLHIAAMRKEPEIIVSLLQKGARPSELTSYGEKAIQISKRLTRAIDYRSIEQEKPSAKDGLCIEILEQAERREPLIGEASNSVVVVASEMLSQLEYLENRVCLAKCLYPAEAKVAMVNAHVDGTLEFTVSRSNLATGNPRASVEFNETPFKIKEEHLLRMRALSKTVELGRRYFPRCSEVINKIMDDDLSELSDVEHNMMEGRRKRFLELQDEMKNAFLQDKQELDVCVLRSSSSRSAGRVRTRSAKRR